MRAGFGTAVLPVEPGTAPGGYVDRVDPSTGTLDELEVNCVCLSTRKARLILVVVDLICVNADLAAAVEHRVREACRADDELPVDVWTMATHTHCGPDVGCQPGGGTTGADWTRRIADLAAQTVRQALDAATECAVDWQRGELHGIGAVRAARQAAATVPVDLLSFLDADRHRRGVLAVVPIHATVLPATNLLVSGDLAGSIRAGLRQRLGTVAGFRPAVLVATGAAGDISTRATRREQTADECHRLGASAAAQIEAILATAPRTRESDARIVTGRRRLSLPGRRDEARELDRLRADLLSTDIASTDPAAERIQRTALQGLDIALRRTAGTPERGYPLELRVALLGDITLVGIGAEPFLCLRAMLADNGTPSILLGYANGYAGYLPDRAAYHRPGYEVLASPFPPGAADATIAAVGDLLTELTTEASPND